MSEPNITNLSQLKELCNNCMADIQTSISNPSIDSNTRIVLDDIARNTSYVLSGIIEYLENLK